MTITYSLDVATTRFCGFAKLLGRWKGSIYKILWKEFLVFIIGYSILSIIYRNLLNEGQRRSFELVVIYFETFIDLIPLSFVLGFYVSLVIGRWWNQYDAIPWPDRLCYMIAAYVHGADDRSRMIRRTLGRYLILMQALTCQSVSTSVKKRFPSTQHLVASGIMTKEERTVYENLDAPYGKWWLPAIWFSALVMRAKKEGRIKDSILEDGLLREFCLYRSACGTMFSYDWISVPLVYTQVVTLATYTYSVALMVGRQYLDPGKGYTNHQVDLYVPVFTLLQFFFYLGWLKVAEQIFNPYGEDDDDFELNWCLDRNCQVVYLIVDHCHTKHPKLRKDKFWDEMLPQLPQTKITAKYDKNPQLGSAFNMEVDPADSEFLPMDTLLEEDNEANVYSSDSMKHANGVRYRPSFLMNILNSNFGQNNRKRSMQKGDSFNYKGHVNPAYVMNMERFAPPRGSMPTISRKSSLAKKSPAHSRASSISFTPSSISRHRRKSYDFQQAETNYANGPIAENESNGIISAMAAAMAPVVANFEGHEDSNPMEADTEYQKPESYMPAIPEEPSRPVSMVSTEPGCEEQKTKQMEGVQNLVAEASKVLEELNRVVASQGHRKDCASKNFKSCCSFEMSDVSSEEDDNNLNPTPVDVSENIGKSSAVIEMGEMEEEEDFSSHDS